jgi:acyl-lipid omega-6 desaturase (Delta-12 desaturase)
MLNPAGALEASCDLDSEHPETADGTDACETGGSLDALRLVQNLKAYRQTSRRRSCAELAITLIPYLTLTAFSLASVQAGYWLGLLLTLPAGGLLLRLFLIQHDCGHGSFWPTRSANDWLGRCLGVLTLTPYACWRRSHALHHAGTGNLDARGFGDVDTLTVSEFLNSSRARQLFYRLYRHPLVLLGLGPAYLFLLRHRLPIGLMKAGRRYWASALGTNAAIVALAIPICSLVSVNTFLMVQLPITLIAASAGVWLFYLQHQFEDTHWATRADWSVREAALRGSSHLDFPVVLRWLTANIGAHHVHHLASSVPYYRIPAVLRAHPELAATNRLSVSKCLTAFRLVLWDAEKGRLISFSALKEA